MGETSESAVRRYLNPSEEAKIVLETLVTPSSNTTGSLSSEYRLPDLGVQDENKRILAVVTHRDRLDGHEEGSVFVFKYSYDSSPVELVVQHIFPIVNDFSLTMAQASRGTLDARPFSRSSLLDQPRSGLTLTINPGEGPSQEPVTLLTSDAHHLRSVLEECKRLKEVFGITASFTRGNTYAWLLPYIAKQNPLLRFSSGIPLDLRIAGLPLHARLSHASAGLSGDDVADIQLIRDEWVHARVHELCRKVSANLTTTIRYSFLI